MVAGEAEQLRKAVEGRAGWRLVGEGQAVYEPAAGAGLMGRIRYLGDRSPGAGRWHAALVDAGGVARYAIAAVTASHARDWVEHQHPAGR